MMKAAAAAAQQKRSNTMKPTALSKKSHVKNTGMMMKKVKKVSKVSKRTISTHNNNMNTSSLSKMSKMSKIPTSSPTTFPSLYNTKRSFFSSETTQDTATTTDNNNNTTTTSTTENNITPTTTIIDSDAPVLYSGSDLYIVRPTGVREATRVIRAFCNTPVDQPVSISINLGLDPRKPNQSVRGMAPVPHGSGGRTVLAVFATGDKAAEAKAAGADIVGAEDLIKEILAGKIEFTRCVATPDMMKHLSKVARVLGPRGLMPNPKLGTVTLDIKGAVENSKLGQIEFRNDKKGVVHAIIGKSSWSVDKIEENVNAFVKAIADAKPSGAKGQYFKSSFLGNNAGWSQNLDIRLFPFKQ